MTTWVLLRGLTREAGHWGDFLPLLEAAMPDSRIVCVDFPGNGALWRERSLTSVPAMLASVRTQLQAQGINGPVAVLALSLGAMVAVEWIRCHPDEVKCGVLVNTSLRPFNPPWRRLRPANYLALLNLLLRNSNVALRERTVLALTSRRQTKQHWSLIESWCIIFRAHPVSRRNALAQIWAAMRYVAPASLSGGRVLLMSGGQDRLVDPRCSSVLAQCWGLPLITHPGAGHDLPLDDPGWVVTQIVQWQRETLVV